MLDDDPELADEIGSLLEASPLGLPCDVLALRLSRRRADVLAELRANTLRFERIGRTSGSRWRIATSAPLSTSRDGTGRNGTGSLDSFILPVRRDAQGVGERFTDFEERT
jgi:hypothetical protein